MTHRVAVAVSLLFLILVVAAVRAGEAPGKLKVSENRRFLVTAEGRPFFYLGDTAWELFHRLNREEAERYLEDRAEKGFTVIQAVAIAELNGHYRSQSLRASAAGRTRSSAAGGPGGPGATITGTTWITSWTEANRAGPLPRFPADLGTLLARHRSRTASRSSPPPTPRPTASGSGKRYKESALIWILGGDRAIDTTSRRRSCAPWRAA